MCMLSIEHFNHIYPLYVNHIIFLTDIKSKCLIKNFVIDEAKIHAQIEENKKKPVKKSKFRERLDAAMKQAQEQQAAQQKARSKK